MAHRTMGEFMTRKVVSVRLDTPFKDTVRTLADNAVSAVPVLDGPGRPGSSRCPRPWRRRAGTGAWWRRGVHHDDRSDRFRAGARPEPQ
ncbi:CBS domain-containing protein [Streptomyces lydicus]|uniref:CBS domain-containing protein n=1 Tax=Streptomyces lydicus TaxID=47763 RepID=UPI0037930EA5